MKEFKYGTKFQWYYWYDEQAVCLNFAAYITPVTFDLVTATKFTGCQRVLIKCLENWDNWKD